MRNIVTVWQKEKFKTSRSVAMLRKYWGLNKSKMHEKFWPVEYAGQKNLIYLTWLTALSMLPKS